MATLRIEGGRRLSGKLAVEGNKNSALPLIAACVLTNQPCELSNVPRIRDVDVLLELIEGLGARVEGRGTSTLRIQCTEIRSDRPDPLRVGKLRGSVLLLGPLLARRGSARLAQPGGDFPTRRTISTHLSALFAMGAQALHEPGYALTTAGLTGASIYLDEASVTGTETALLAAAAARGSSEIRHAATEPHVVELCEFLQKMGVGVEGGGTSTIRVQPAARFSGARHTLNGDYIEAGSWGVVAAITNGEIEVTGARSADLESFGNLDLGVGRRWWSIWRRSRSTARRAGRSIARPAVEPSRGAADYNGTLARLSQRHGQPGNGTRDASRRPHAGARLDVRAAVVCARADERDACGPLPLRPAPDHCQRPDEIEGTIPRQPRSAIRNGIDCRRAGG